MATHCSDDTPPTAEVPEPTAPTVPATTSTTSTTVAPAATPDLGIPLTLTPVTTVTSPTAMTAWPGRSAALVAERSGVVREIDLSTTPAGDEGTALDLTDSVGEIAGEQGLLGLAIDSAASVLVVSYTDGNDDGASVIETFELDGDSIDETSRREILRVDQPFANHNGGNVAFGPEGSLYIGFGDGGSQGDPGLNGQNPSTLLGSMLRIDLNPADAAIPYSVRADNPFALGEGGRQEVFLYGLRNPWRFSFDRMTGDLWIGDVGDSSWEEIDVLWASQGGGSGSNLGWSLREGRHDTSRSGALQGNVVEPIAEYDHDSGSSVTGGYVYRGEAIPELAGAYLYADYSRPGVRALVADDGATDVSDSADLDIDGSGISNIVSFGQDNDGELYVLSLDGGVYRIDPR